MAISANEACEIVENAVKPFFGNNIKIYAIGKEKHFIVLKYKSYSRLWHLIKDHVTKDFLYCDACGFCALVMQAEFEKTLNNGGKK